MIFSEGSGVSDSAFGKMQAPLQRFLLSREEAYEKEDVLFSVYSEQKSNNWGEGYGGMTGFAGFQPVGENGAYPQEEIQEGYTKIIENETWKDSFAVSKEMVDDNKLNQFKNRPEGFVKGYYRTRNEFGASLLGAAVSGGTSVKFGSRDFDARCADGGALFSKTHGAKVKGAAQSNLFAGDLTAANLAAMETAMQNYRGDNDELLGVAPDTLLIPNIGSLKTAAFAAVGSMQDPSSANNAFNYLFGRWKIIIWPYLNKYLASGLAPWFLLDSSFNDTVGTLIWQTREELNIRSELAGNDANVWKGRARYAAGFNDFRGIAVGGITGGTAL